MVLLYVLAAVVLINCGYYILFSKFSFLKPPTVSTYKTYPVSIIICAKNEAENLAKNIPSILAQAYPNFEVILINDSSSDNTLDVMEDFANEDNRVKIVNVENNEAFWGNKKYALTLGIKKAVNKRMLFTDADCKPASPNWLAEMTKNLDQTKQLVLGYGAYVKEKGFLNALIRFETLMTALQYFSYAKAGTPYMGVGRNLAYTSKLYYDNNGFISHIQLPSGDDDLFVNEVATSANTVLCFSEESFTISKPKTTFKAWLLQKRRHVTTAKLYKPKHKFLLSTYYVANLLFWLLTPVCLLLSNWKIVLAVVLVRLLCQYIVVGKAAQNLKERNLIPFLPFLELFLVCFQLSIFIFNSSAKPTRWK
ncbi:glycosyltransferase [Rasiella rasia]|uniref:Glycosyltransferase n=1 Tax=Rasiella rasia TaxID=2744027 RepID=A0A6G6GPL4_9FLAO|nr:glycosyltransferase [Rasiella rasia]QIE60488.1 glycosyltransferase [Rasiella rasia]